jgi:hypothetical protein
VWTQTLPTGSVNLWGWGDAVLVSDPRRLWLLDAATGKIRFVINAADDELRDSQGDNPDGLPIQITGVVLSAATAFVGLNTATIAVDRTGERLWRRPRPDPRNGVRPPEGAPLTTLGRWLVTHDPSGQVAHLGLRDTSDGTLQWLAQYDAPPAGPPPGGPNGPPGHDDSWSRHEGRITNANVVIRDVQALRVVTLARGQTVWSATSPTPIAGIELFGSAVLVAADRLRAYDVATQAELWDYDARGARVAVTATGGSVFVAGADGMSLVDVNGRRRWFEPYPSDLINAAPDWAGVAGDLGYVTFRPQGGQPLDVDVIAVNLGTAA